MSSNASKVHSACFNAQQDCFSVATDSGLRMFNTHPAVLLRSFSREQIGGIKVCSILHRSNIIVFVGGGSYAKFPSNTVMVWDDKLQELVLEVTVAGGPILNVLLAYSKLVVLQDKRIHVFQFPNPCKLIRTEEIRYNPSGLAAIGCDFNGTSQMLAYPGFKVGSVQLVNLNNMSECASLSPRGIDAHLNEVTQLALNNQATLLATGSAKGTVIRIFDTNAPTTRCIMEFRRGADPCTLHCLQFSPCSSFLAVSSDKGTIHIFTLRDTDDARRGLLHKGTIHIFTLRDTDDARRGLLHKLQVGLTKGERRSSVQISLEPRVLACGFIKGYMGHRGFGQKSLSKVQQPSKTEEYSRTPNPNARNYFEEMAPVNGIRELTEEQLSEAQARRDEFRDDVSKRMGELLLRGVTMLDAYCQVCNGILMEDRNGVRTCVTCELFAERTKEGSRLVAEVPLDATADGVAPGNSLLASEEPPAQPRNMPRIVNVDRSYYFGNQELQSHRTAPETKSRESTPSATASALAPPSSQRRTPTSCPLEGYNAALSAVDRKLKWASEKLEHSENVTEIREIFALVSEGMKIIKTMRLDDN
ncbi:Sjogren'S syndrome/scleroderma autoantigen 1 [Oesophagostomum dentatum]|uniref:Sjogren'S syndrome/scleroderma autoantigen 1 n=1 Tax=Oesophagostomum dentatum TaxID=61180 RepID=A0A0B1TAW9_OESDE|nr:Sjogren'S syndrome/scleroderma autoantigen 1 [Oesophagostomum dentatum]